MRSESLGELFYDNDLTLVSVSLEGLKRKL